MAGSEQGTTETRFGEGTSLLPNESHVSAVAQETAAMVRGGSSPPVTAAAVSADPFATSYHESLDITVSLPSYSPSVYLSASDSFSSPPTFEQEQHRAASVPQPLHQHPVHPQRRPEIYHLRHLTPAKKEEKMKTRRERSRELSSKSPVSSTSPPGRKKRGYKEQRDERLFDSSGDEDSDGLDEESRGRSGYETHGHWKLRVEDFEPFIRHPEQLKSIAKKSVRKFYEKQNKVIEVICAAIRGELFNEDAEPGLAAFAINLSLGFNLLLFIIKLYASYISESLSVVSSTIDSFLDLFSGLIIWFTTRERVADVFEYPVGKKNRLEPLGVIVFAAVMGTAVLQLVSQAGEDLYSGFTSREAPEVSPPRLSYVIILVSVVFIKFGLWLVCRSVSRKIEGSSPSVDALAQDHFNDVFTNSFAITTALLGSYLYWWIDPLGAGLMGIYITIFWARAGYEQIKVLSGYRASKKFCKQLIVLAWNHHPMVHHIDTVRAYHFGTDLIVEVDIILPEKTELKKSHDIAEDLQIKYEMIPSVARSYVHIDYEADHRPEHKIPDNEPFKSPVKAATTPAHL